MPGPLRRGYRAGDRPCVEVGARAVRRRRSGYLSSLCLRLGLRANHQMLAMVASTPKAAAGFAILRERSDME